MLKGGRQQGECGGGDGRGARAVLDGEYFCVVSRNIVLCMQHFSSVAILCK